MIHLRINTGADVVWEGSVPLVENAGGVPDSFDLELRPLLLRSTESLRDLLVYDTSWDHMEGVLSCLNLLTFTLVAVRQADLKMIPL